MIDTSKPYVRVTIARSMEGVEPGTGIPGLTDLIPHLQQHGFEQVGFESVDPTEQLGPTAMQETLKKLRALHDTVESEIREIECYGDPQPGTADDEDDDFLEEMGFDAYYRIENAWNDYRDHYEEKT